VKNITFISPIFSIFPIFRRQELQLWVTVTSFDLQRLSYFNAATLGGIQRCSTATSFCQQSCCLRVEPYTSRMQRLKITQALEFSDFQTLTHSLFTLTIPSTGRHRCVINSDRSGSSHSRSTCPHSMAIIIELDIIHSLFD